MPLFKFSVGCESIQSKKLHQSKSSNVCVITGISYSQLGGTSTLTRNIVDILHCVDKKIYVVCDSFTKEQFADPSGITFLILSTKSKNNFFQKILSIIIAQLEISFLILRLRRKIDGGFLFISGSLFVPTIMCRIVGKKAFLVNPASEYSTLRILYNKEYLLKYIYPPFAKLMEKLTQMSSTKIVLSSPSLSSYLGLTKYKYKTLYAPGEYVRNRIFKIYTPFTLRSNLIGYAGRLSEEKGVISFIEAIPLILKKENNLNFIIIGDGPLKEYIMRYLEKHCLYNKVSLVGWVPQNELPFYLNQLRLLTLPSYTEGLPNIVLESMACGTPVLATSVGSIPDLIDNNKTGFILDNNCASTIAQNVVDSINSTDIEKISNSAYNYVTKEYSLEAVAYKYSEIFE